MNAMILIENLGEGFNMNINDAKEAKKILEQINDYKDAIKELQDDGYFTI